jgi:hypothetical protein
MVEFGVIVKTDPAQELQVLVPPCCVSEGIVAVPTITYCPGPKVTVAGIEPL